VQRDEADGNFLAGWLFRKKAFGPHGRWPTAYENAFGRRKAEAEQYSVKEALTASTQSSLQHIHKLGEQDPVSSLSSLRYTSYSYQIGHSSVWLIHPPLQPCDPIRIEEKEIPRQQR
jgi:hypothetical protein